MTRQVSVFSTLARTSWQKCGSEKNHLRGAISRLLIAPTINSCLSAFVKWSALPSSGLDISLAALSIA